MKTKIENTWYIFKGDIYHAAWGYNYDRALEGKRPVPTWAFGLGVVLRHLVQGTIGRVACKMVGHNEEIEESDDPNAPWVAWYCCRCGDGGKGYW